MVCHLNSLKILRVVLTSSWIFDNIEGYALPLAERCHASSLDGADMNENVRGAVGRLMKPKPPCTLKNFTVPTVIAAPRDFHVEMLDPLLLRRHSKMPARVKRGLVPTPRQVTEIGSASGHGFWKVNGMARDRLRDAGCFGRRGTIGTLGR
jgi:hypothetical protein